MARDDSSDLSERYELVERIAVGGMAEVFRAKKYGSHGFAKQMAVKRILPNLAADDEFVTRFIAEAKIAVTLSHANIVQVFDFSRFGESLYIAMEYVDGADLASLLARVRRKDEAIGLAAALHIAMELLKGLDFAHGKDVVHRDISPSNILISRAGEVKIADFGIAQAAGLRLTREHHVMGKWPYMSPEQTRGDELAASSDLFSAGTVLYELLTGTRLFRGQDAGEIRDAIIGAPIEPPSSRRPALPVEIDAPVLALLDRDPSARPSAAATLDALIALSYRSALQATSAALSSEIERWVPPSGGTETGSAQLLDDIINSELAHAQANVGRNTRVTLEATGLGPVHGGEKTPMTFVKTRVGPQGLSEWVVGDASGTYALRRTELLYAVAPEKTERPTVSLKKTPPEAIKPATNPPPTERSEPSEPITTSRPRRWWLAAAVVALAAVAALLVAQGRDDQSASHRGDTSRRADASASAVSTTTPTRIELTSSPDGARVFLDGRDIGRTPLTIDHPGPAARVAIRMDGFEDCVEQTTLDTREIGCKLIAALARLTVLTTPPGASVFIGDELLGKTPLRNIELPARTGSTAVTIKKRGYQTTSQRVALTAGSSAQVQRELEADAEKGRIDIDCEPWANVYFRGKKIGVAPARGLELPAGTHRLTLVNPDENRRSTLEVTIPGPRRYTVKLP